MTRNLAVTEPDRHDTADDDIIITDEKTLLRNELADTKRQLTAVRQDRDRALAKLRELERRDENNGRLLSTITDSNVTLKRQIELVKRKYRQQLYETQQDAGKRETVAGVIGMLGGFLASAVIVVIYYMTRNGVF